MIIKIYLLLKKKLKNDIKKCLTIILENQDIKELLNIKVWDNEKKTQEIDYVDVLKNRKNGDSGKTYIRENSDIASDCMKQIKYGDIDENYKVLTYNHAIILINTLLNAQYKSGKPIEPEIQKLIEELKKRISWQKMVI
ncbi:hypothetical protein [Campylobacter sp.]|uniref:hypothetical protein n=1 Tax=Campylobacter sp. TaxID=205 RepID=UPI002AA6795B|nr:hypothetical protein [Campylobacter sp.]MCI7076915.1 hypothetical protein [Campylobacter sp.]